MFEWKDICIFITSEPGIVTTSVGLDAWAELFGKPSVNEVLKTAEILVNLQVSVTTLAVSFKMLLLLITIDNKLVRKLIWLTHSVHLHLELTLWKLG